MPLLFLCLLLLLCGAAEGIDWNTLVSLKEIENSLDGVMSAAKTSSTTHQSPLATPAESLRIREDKCDACLSKNESNHQDAEGVGAPESPPNAKSEQFSASDDAVKKDGADGLVEADVFRIEASKKEPSFAEDYDVKPGDVQVEDAKPNDGQPDDDVEPEEPLEMKSDDLLDDNPSDELLAAPTVGPCTIPLAKVNFMMDKVCAMFPVSIVDDFDLNEGLTPPPFITIKPSYLATISGEDLLFAFDEIMFPRVIVANESFAFLSNPTLSVYSSWLGNLRVASNITSPDERSIPLYMLLLSRFQTSAYEAFQNRLNDVTVMSEKDAPADVIETVDVSTAAEEVMENVENVEATHDVVDCSKDHAVSDETIVALGSDQETLSPKVESTEKSVVTSEPVEVNNKEDACPDSAIVLSVAIPDCQLDGVLLGCQGDHGRLRENAREHEPDQVLDKIDGSPTTTSSKAMDYVSLLEERVAAELCLDCLQSGPLVSLYGRLTLEERNDKIMFKVSKEFLDSFLLASSEVSNAPEIVPAATSHYVAATDPPALQGTDGIVDKAPSDGIEDKAPLPTETAVDHDWIDEPIPGLPCGGQSLKKSAKKKKKKKVRLSHGT
jgi:hypothetical protein